MKENEKLARFNDANRSNTDRFASGKISYAEHQRKENQLRKKHLGSTGVKKSISKKNKSTSTKKKSSSKGEKHSASFWRKKYFGAKNKRK